MAKVNSILDQRMKKPSNTSKMAEMAKQSASGNLTSFSGIFSIVELSTQEKEIIENILKSYANEEQEIAQDLNALLSLTSEVKAINNQAALLHGERIKKAHQILINYRDGAFTAWMVATYGNRQTPYNLMQYYEFYEAMPKQLRPQIELMPRQAVYVLASRTGSLDKKQKIVENYQGETKEEMLSLIRQIFPLDQTDKRKQQVGNALIHHLQRIYQQFKRAPQQLTSAQRKQILALLHQCQQLIGSS
jgi:Uncharacterised protein family (UPF0137)